MGLIVQPECARENKEPEPLAALCIQTGKKGDN